MDLHRIPHYQDWNKIPAQKKGFQTEKCHRCLPGFMCCPISFSLPAPDSSQQREGVVGCGVETGLLRSTHLDLLTVLPWHRCMTVDPRYFTSLSLSFISCWKGDNLTCLKVAVRISYSYESTLKQKRDPLKFVMF